MHELFFHYSLIKNVLLVQSKFGTVDLILFEGPIEVTQISGLQPVLWGLRGHHGNVGGFPQGGWAAGLETTLPAVAQLLSVSWLGFLTWLLLSKWLCGLSSWDSVIRPRPSFYKRGVWDCGEMHLACSDTVAWGWSPCSLLLHCLLEYESVRNAGS